MIPHSASNKPEVQGTCWPQSIQILLSPECHPEVSINGLAVRARGKPCWKNAQQYSSFVTLSKTHKNTKTHTHTHTQKLRIFPTCLSELITIMQKNITQQQKVVMRASICCSVNLQLNLRFTWVG